MITPIIGKGHVHADFDLTKRYGGGYGHWDNIHPSYADGWMLSTYTSNRKQIELKANIDSVMLNKALPGVKYHVGGYTEVSKGIYVFDIWAPAEWAIKYNIFHTSDSSSDKVIGSGLLYDTWGPEEFDTEIVKCLNKAYIAAYRESPTPGSDSRIRAALETIQSNGTIAYDELDIYAYTFIPSAGIPSDLEIDLLGISDFQLDHKDEKYYYYRFNIHSSKVSDPLEVYETFLNV